MENPATWGKLETAISDALKDADDARAKGLVGGSRAKIIANKLRERGLVKPSECNHVDYSNDHCAEMLCWNYFSKCPKHSYSGSPSGQCSLDIFHEALETYAG